MEPKTELISEIDVEQEEEKVVEWGDVSQETKGWPTGWRLEALGGGKYY